MCWSSTPSQYMRYYESHHVNIPYNKKLLSKIVAHGISIFYSQNATCPSLKWIFHRCSNKKNTFDSEGHIVNRDLKMCLEREVQYPWKLLSLWPKHQSEKDLCES